MAAGKKPAKKALGKKSMKKTKGGILIGLKPVAGLGTPTAGKTGLGAGPLLPPNLIPPCPCN